MYMQNNVSARSLEIEAQQNGNPNKENALRFAEQNFGTDNVSVTDSGIIKVLTNEIGSGDVLSLSILLQWSIIRIKRSGLGLLILLIPKRWVFEDIDWDNLPGEDISSLIPEPQNKAPMSNDDLFKHAAAPLMDFLNENHHPHVYATVDSESAMLIEGLQTVKR